MAHRRPFNKRDFERFCNGDAPSYSKPKLSLKGFQRFPTLPTEIRLMIWSALIQPRIIDATKTFRTMGKDWCGLMRMGDGGRGEVDSTKCCNQEDFMRHNRTPSVLHINKESRQYGLKHYSQYLCYQQLRVNCKMVRGKMMRPFYFALDVDIFVGGSSNKHSNWGLLVPPLEPKRLLVDNFQACHQLTSWPSAIEIVACIPVISKTHLFCKRALHDPVEISLTSVALQTACEDLRKEGYQIRPSEKGGLLVWTLNGYDDSGRKTGTGDVKVTFARPRYLCYEVQRAVDEPKWAEERVRQDTLAFRKGLEKWLAGCQREREEKQRDLLE